MRAQLLIPAVSLIAVFLVAVTRDRVAWAAEPAALAAETARQVRENGLDPTACYRVRDLSFTRDDAKLFFNDGYLIFAKPVQGRRWAALFTPEVEGGDGEIMVIPPDRQERQSLASFTQSPNLDEHLRAALIIATGGLDDSLFSQVQNSPGVKLAADMAPALVAEWNGALSAVAGRTELRLVHDLLTAKANLADLSLIVVSGKTLGTVDVVSDGRLSRRMEVRQIVNRAGTESVNVLTSFVPRAARKSFTGQSKKSAEFEPLRYRIETEIGQDLALKAVSKVAVRIGPTAVRAFPFEIAANVNVRQVRVDGVAAEVLRDYHSQTLVSGDRESEFLVVLPEALLAGSEHEIEFEHDGNVITTRGEGVYSVSARGSWYPHVPGVFSTFDLKFKYPKRLTLVAAGNTVEDSAEGDWKTTRRQVTVPIGAAGFNLGVYEKIAGTAAGVAFEVYGNRNLETALRPQPVQVSTVPSAGRGLSSRMTTPSAPPVMVLPDPLGRLRLVAADLASALEFFSAVFGPPALNTLTVAPIPGTFGQGFPGLVYLSTFAYLDPLERPAALRNANEQVFFSDLLVPHEAAHQWWGSVVTAGPREDAWLMEALANYSALLWLEKKKGFKAVQDVLDNYRGELLSKDSMGSVRESAGPVVWGERLESSPVDSAWRVVTYDKGTWILHMLRRRMGDDAFFRLLRTVRTRFESRTLSTLEFQDLVRELRPKNVTAEAIDNFFDNWVYRTGIPMVKLKSSVKGTAPALKLSGSIEQSDVDDDFSADIPVEVRTGRVTQTLWVRSNGESKSFSAALTQPGAQAAVANDVLVRR